MLEGPDDRVQDEFELGWSDGQKGWEALGGGSLKQVEEVGSVFWEFFKVLPTQRQENQLRRAVSKDVVFFKFTRDSKAQTDLVDHI